MNKPLNDIELFAAKYLSHHLKCRVPDFHRDLYDLAISDEERIVIAAPRGFAKSTIFSLFSPLFEIFFGTAKKIFMVSATAELAKQWIAMMKEEIEGNAVIREDFGDVSTKIKWTEDHIVCRRGPRDLVHVVAKGAGYQLRGFRPDLIVIDDVETDDGVASDVQREKLLSWFNKALVNTLNLGGRLRMIGTNIHPCSLLRNVMDRENWVARKYQAYVDDAWTQSLWPELWPHERLQDRLEDIGLPAFNSEFMNDPVISEDPVFVKRWFKYYDPNDEGVIEDLSTKPRTVIACDPAISQRDGADYTAIVVLTVTGRDPNIKYYVRDIVRGHWSMRGTVNELVGFYETYAGEYPTVVIETVAYQQALAEEIERYKKNYSAEFKVKKIKPDKDKIRRAKAVHSEVQQGAVFFQKEKHRLLIEEMFLFPTGDHDDLVDAYVYAFTEARRIARHDRLPVGPYIVGAPQYMQGVA